MNANETYKKEYYKSCWTNNIGVELRMICVRKLFKKTIKFVIKVNTNIDNIYEEEH